MGRSWWGLVFEAVSYSCSLWTKMYSFKSSTDVKTYISTPSCRICLEPFDEGQHLPKILQCAHTVCERCIGLLDEQSRINHNRPPIDRSFVHIRCPVCRAVTQTPRNYIRSNYQLIELMDSMRGEADHNISFLACVGCNGVYHEKDTNICTTCSPIIKDAHPTELIEQGVILNQYALCSTCLLRDHIKKNHVSISLQPLRVEMQRQENQRRIVGLQDNLHKVQRDFREQLNATMERWAGWNGSHDLSMDKFRELGDTYNQKKVYDAFVHQLRGKTAKIEKLAEHVLRWNDELDREMERPPAHRLPRSSTPAPAPPFDNSVAYYFEHQF